MFLTPSGCYAGLTWVWPVVVRSVDGFTIADADDPQPGQRSVGHLYAHPLAGTQEAKATGVHHTDVKGYFAAIVKQHAA